MARSRSLAVLAGGALGLAVLAACNSLIGLDEFDKAQCSGARCDAGPLPDVVVVGDAGGQDAKAEGGKGSDPVSWARWKMPNYDGGPDAALPNPLSYAKSGDEVTDTVTQVLTWKDDVTGPAVTYDQAIAACAGLQGSWRLPKRIELVTVLDFGQPTDSVLRDPRFKFLNVKVWTSSEGRPYVGGPDQPYWTVDFDTGVVAPQKASKIANVLCVKAK